MEENSAGATGGILVTKPASAPSPSIVIRAPLFLGLCQDMTLDASGSFGAAGRPLKFTYGMLPNVPNEQQLSRSLTQKSLTGDEMEITLPADMFAIGCATAQRAPVSGRMMYQRKEESQGRDSARFVFTSKI